MTRASSSRSLFQKIVAAHLEDGEVVPGRTVALRVDQTFTSGPAGTLAYLQFEAMGLERVATEVSVAYLDATEGDPDAQAYLASIAARYGIHLSRLENGPGPQVHTERFAAPGKTLLGATPAVGWCGGMGMLTLCADPLDIAVAMGGGMLQLRCPEVVQVFLKGRLRAPVSARDVALELLRRRSAKGGGGKVIEYCGPGVKTLTLDERTAIAGLSTLVGAVACLFPSDDRTRAFLQAERRVKAYRRIEADADATYDDREEIDLSALEPLVAPWGPSRVGVRPARDFAGTAITGAVVGTGGCASTRDLFSVGALLKGRKLRGARLVVGAGSRQVQRAATDGGVFAQLRASGADVAATEFTSPPGAALVQVGDDASEHGSWLGLVSAETAAASVVHGEIVDPRQLKRVPKITLPRRVVVDDSLLVRPQKDGTKVEIRRGPRLLPLTPFVSMPTDVSGRVLLKVGDDVTTAHILREPIGIATDLPGLASLVFQSLDKEFAKRSHEWGGGCVVGGESYGLGPSRGCVPLALRHVGVRFVVARSFARAHLQDLVHYGILPLVFQESRDADAITPGDDLHVPEAAARLRVGRPVIIENRTTSRQIEVRYDLLDREREILVEGGLLPYTKRRARKGKEAVAA